MTNTKTATVTFPVVLKTILGHVVRDVPNSTLDTKKMRVKLRARPPFDHDANAAWIATNAREYDAIRSMFDPVYAARIAKTNAPATVVAE